MIDKVELYNILTKNDNTNFIVKEGTTCGEEVLLITPSNANNVQWTERNLDLRSIILDRQAADEFILFYEMNPDYVVLPKILSRGYPKFFNYFEEGQLKKCGVNFSEKDLINGIWEPKIDGSCLLIDLIDGKLNARTRGNVNAFESFPESSDELNELLDKYIRNNPERNLIFSLLKKYTLIFEWTTPNNRIILDYGNKPELYLTGAIRKTWDRVMLSQCELDKLAATCGFKREKARMDIKTAGDIEKLKQLKNIEGFCVYLQDGQTIIKCKTQDYLLAASAKSRGLMNFYSLFKFWKDQPQKLDSDIGTLENLIESTFSAEVLEVLRKDGIFNKWEIYNAVACNAIFYVYNLICNAAYKLLFLDGWSLQTLPEKEIFVLDLLLKEDSNINIHLELFDTKTNKAAKSNIGKFYQIIESQVKHSTLLGFVFNSLFNILRKEFKKKVESRESLLNKANFTELLRDTFIKTVILSKNKDDIESTRIEVEANFFSIDKTLFILRGVPGSGKSSLITNLVQNSLTAHGSNKVRVCSTDNYFINPKTNEYEFDATKLFENHKKCFDACEEAMMETDHKNAVSFIFLDNTNIQEKHIKPYRELAEKYGYTVIELLPNDMFDLLQSNDPQEIEDFLKLFTERNAHGVSYETIKQMYLNLKQNY